MSDRRIPREPPPEAAELDVKATAEATAVASGDLESEAQRAQHKRREAARDHIGQATIWSIWIAFFVIVVGGLTWAWHMLAPAGWRYLSAQDIAAVHALLSNVIVGAVLGFLVKNKFM